MIAKKPEAQTVIILLFLSLIICVAGALLYKNLSSISKDIRSSYNYEDSPSLIMRKLIAEIREAEINVKAYNLTNDKDFLISFYTSVALVDEELTELKDFHRKDKESKALIDSAIVLCGRKFEILKKQLYLDDEKQITNELNIISTKVKQTYPLANNSPSLVIDKSDNHTTEKEGFLKRLFSKKKKNNNDSLTKTIEQLKQKEEQLKRITGEIKTTVQKVKISQIEKLHEIQLYELQLAREGKKMIDEIRVLYLEMETHEKQENILKIELANKKMDEIKTLSIALSVFISILLLIVGYFILAFLKRKKSYELALLNAKEKAEDLAKTKEMFLANMSHEIRTPLNAIYGFTQQLLSSELNDEQKNQIIIVKKSTEHLSRLVTDVLMYSKLKSGKIELEISSFDLVKELKEIESLFIIQAKQKGILFSINTNKISHHIISSDLYKIKQILFNLISNAIKFTEKGYVEISVTQLSSDSENSLEIIVLDSGIGISPEKMNKLFQEYEQGDSNTFHKYGGTGLGLAITKQLVDRLNGYIEIKSEVNKGTLVTVGLPVELSDKEDFKKIDKNTSETDVKEKLNGKKILIVDDDEFNRLLLKSILGKYKVTLDEATNGQEAVDLVKEKAFDAIIMDVRMPIKNGVEATKEIREFNKSINIIASTAVASEEKIARCMAAGVSSIVFKPFVEKDLIDILIKENSRTNSIYTQVKVENKLTNPDVINLEALDNYVFGNQEFKLDLILTFQKSLYNALQSMRTNIQDGAYSTMGEYAHKILPSCRHFNADEMVDVLKKIENYRNRTTFNEQEVLQEFAILETLAEKANEIINKYLKN